MKHVHAGGSAPPFSKVIVAVSLAVGLGGCGGGGGSDGNGVVDAPPASVSPETAASLSGTSTTTTSTTTSTTTTPTPITSTPSSVWRDPFGTVAGSEPAASVSSPQGGSTAAVGNGSEGIYESTYGYTFVSGTGDIARKTSNGTIWGSVSITGANWVFNPETEQYASSFSPVTGSGTFSAKASMDGSYSVGGRSSTAWGPQTYSSANALAVTQSSVAGKWASPEASNINVSVTVDAAGAFTGRTSGWEIGVCALSGSVLLSQPGTAKNLYTVTLTAVNAAAQGETACALDPIPYSGPSALVFVPAGFFVGNGYFRNLALMVRDSNKATFWLTMGKA